MHYPTATTADDIRRHVTEVRARIAAAAERAGRSASDIRLLPVSKTIPEERIRAAVQVGCREFGENKVQEADRKRREHADLDIARSIIGHLQTNKVRNVVAFATEFQALDSAARRRGARPAPPSRGPRPRCLRPGQHVGGGQQVRDAAGGPPSLPQGPAAL